MKVLFLLLMLSIYFPGGGEVQADNTGESIADRYETVSDKGAFNIGLRREGGSLRVGKNSVELSISDSDFRALEGADIRVVPWMPEMGHGVFEEPVVSEKGGGIYQVDNIYLFMPGHWELRIEVKKEGVRDRVVFSFEDVGTTDETESKVDESDEKTLEALAHLWSHTMPQGSAPIGVMGDHTHHEGAWMLSYRFMYMDMEGNRDGTSRVSDEDVIDPGKFNFLVTPTDMSMEMHMFGAMFAPTEDLTLMAMVPYIRYSMNHLTRMGIRFRTDSDGFGDFSMSGLYNIYRYGGHNVLINLGLSFPTGSIDERDETPMGPDQKLPYPMQLGSGTFDIIPGVTYTGITEDWGFGGQTLFTFRLGENSNEYTLGDRFNLTAWISRRVFPWLSTSVRASGQVWGNIDGADPELNPAIVPTADPDRRGGERIDLLLGANIYITGGFFEGHRIAVEGGVPLYQSLDGPQLETDWVIYAGWQKLF